MNKRIYIGIGFDSYRPWNRRVLHGVMRYAREKTEWHLVLSGLATRGLGFFAKLADQADGWIVDRPYRTLPESLPQVVLTPEPGDAPKVAVVSDMRAIGALAANALWEAGYRRAACLQIETGRHPPDDERDVGFRGAAQTLGMEVQTLPSPLVKSTIQREVQRDLLDCLHALAKPAGLFAHNLNEAHALSFFLAEAELDVPHDAGLIVGGDDRTGLEALIPSISGIDRNMELIGWTAARQLHRALLGEAVEPLLRVPPLGVVERESTRLDRVDDPALQRALRYMRENVGDAPSMEAIARAAHVSPSTLHRRFRDLRSHTPAEEIRRIRLAKALSLLRTTNLPLIDVSARCGFAESSQLSRAVKAATGLPPRSFRQAAR